MENLKIYIDRLKGGHPLKIEETLSPEFLDVHEEELAFEEPVHVKGEAYLAEDHLVMHLAIKTSAILPCAICNDAVVSPIGVKDVYLTEPLSEIKTAIFDLTDLVRETILLQIPLFVECKGGKCPERDNIKRFLKPEEKSSASEEINHFPFADLQ